MAVDVTVTRRRLPLSLRHVVSATSLLPFLKTTLSEKIYVTAADIFFVKLVINLAKQFSVRKVLTLKVLGDYQVREPGSNDCRIQTPPGSTSLQLIITFRLLYNLTFVVEWLDRRRTRRFPVNTT